MKPKKGSWIVRMKCEVTKEVICEDCTEEQARANPFEYSSQETELDQIDYDVRSVEPNE